MSTAFPFFLSAAREDLQELRRNWGWFVALGVALVIIGTVAICYPFLASVAAMEVFGFLLLIGAGVQVASGIWARRWSGFFLHLLGGLLYLFVGLVLVERPGLGLAIYTLLLAVFFVASGLFRIVFALSQRFSGWGWTLLAGVVSLLLGIIIWRQFPLSALWVIGTFIGIDLIFAGWSWVMLGAGLRNLPAAPVTPSASLPDAGPSGPV
jgi:uncharacterized membrane protein HdeD (DUF308 family)